MSALQTFLMWFGVASLTWLAIGCVASYLRADPPETLPPPNVRSKRYQPNDQSRWWA